MGYPPLRLSGKNLLQVHAGDTIIPAVFPSPSGPFSADSPYNLAGLAGLAEMAAFNRPATTTTQTSAGAGSQAYSIGGVLAPNGYIYGIPNGNTNLLKINPLGGTSMSSVKIVAPITSFAGGVLVGNYIYCMPYGSSKLLVINTASDALAQIAITSGICYCYGGVLAPNGNIYGMSQSPGFPFLKIVPDGSGGATTSSLGTSLLKAWGMVLALNGCIYSVPGGASAPVYVFNPASDTVVATVTTGVTGYWAGGVLAPNGQIYCAPQGSAATQYILVITPTGSGASASCTIGTITLTSVSGMSWNGGALAPNGLIYFAPMTGSAGPLVVDPVAGTATMLPYTVTSGFAGAVAHSTGIYGIPTSPSQPILCITDGFLSVPQNFLLSPCFNKY